MDLETHAEAVEAVGLDVWSRCSGENREWKHPRFCVPGTTHFSPKDMPHDRNILQVSCLDLGEAIQLIGRFGGAILEARHRREKGGALTTNVQFGFQVFNSFPRTKTLHSFSPTFHPSFPGFPQKISPKNFNPHTHSPFTSKNRYYVGEITFLTSGPPGPPPHFYIPNRMFTNSLSYRDTNISP